MAGGKLTALQVTKAKAPGMYGDGGGLYLQITGDGKQMIAISQNGKLSLVHLDIDGPKVVSQTEIFRSSYVWSAPVIYHGKLYVKGKDELVCLDVSAK